MTGQGQDRDESTEDPSTSGAAVVSAYQPDFGLLDRASCLLKEFGHVIVVDDGSPDPDNGLFEALNERGVHVLRSPSNAGIAAALNRGISYARTILPSEGYVVTFDQDSEVRPGFASALASAWKSAEEQGVRVAMVAPGRISGLPSRVLRHDKGVLHGDEPIQSGLLIPLTAVSALGPFDESLFIDGVDTEFYLRALDGGWASIIAPDAELVHALGSMVEASIFGAHLRVGAKSLRVRTAAPWRYYYITRNRAYLVARFGRRHPWWSTKALAGDFRHLAIVTLLAPGRTDRLRHVVAGLVDYRSGVLGKRSRFLCGRGAGE